MERIGGWGERHGEYDAEEGISATQACVRKMELNTYLGGGPHWKEKGRLYMVLG